MQSQNYQEIIQDLLDCALTSEQCVVSCLSDSYPQKMDRCIKLARDCKDVCGLLAKFLSRNSALAPQMVVVCEELCRLCAFECQKNAQLKHCKDCADSCNRCAQSLRLQLEEAVQY
jgi:hypothetical protein